MELPLVESAGTSARLTTQRWALAASVLASSMAFIDGAALHVAFPALQADLDASGIDLLWVINGYALFLTSLLLIGGALGDRYGRRRILLLGLFIFTAASCACGLAPDAGALIVARGVQGVGAALLIPGSLALLTCFSNPAERGRAIGTWSALTVVATAVGPILGGVLSDAGWWRGVFFVNVPLAILAAAILAKRVPETRAPAPWPRLDVRGALLATLGLFGVNYGIIESPMLGWEDARVLLATSAGVAALVVFVLHEARVGQPLLPLRLFRSKNLTGTILVTLCLYGGFHALVFFLPLNLVQVQGYTAASAGLAQLPLMLLLVALSGWAGGLADRLGPRLPLTVGPLVAGAGFVLLAVAGLTRGPIDYWTHVLPPLVVLGLGMALTCAPLTATLMAAVGPEQAGLASGINSTTARLAGLLAVSLLGSSAVSIQQRALARRGYEAGLLPPLVNALEKEAANLGNARVSLELDNFQQNTAREVVRRAFVDTFRVVTLSAAGLAGLAGLAGALLIRRPAEAC